MGIERLQDDDNGDGGDSTSTLMFWMTIGTTILVIVGSVLYKLQKDLQKKLDLYPPTIPNFGLIEFVGNMAGKNGPKFLLHLSRKYQTNLYRFPGTTSPPGFIVTDPYIARKILEDPTNTKPYRSLEFFNHAAGGGDTFFVANDIRYSHVRKSTSKAFSPTNVTLMEDMIYEILMSEQFHQKWQTQCLSSSTSSSSTDKIIPIDVDEEMILLTTQVISKVAFEYDMSAETRLHFVNTMRCAMEGYFLQRLHLGKLLVPFLYADMRATRRAALEMVQFAHDMMKHFRNNPNPKKHTVMYMIMNDEQYNDDEERARDILIYFFAGYDTTAHSISWTLLELARHPKEQEGLYEALMKYQQEHRQQGDEDEKKGQGKENGEKNQLMSWKYCTKLKNVTRESLRLHTPASLGSAREMNADMTVSMTNPKTRPEWSKDGMELTAATKKDDDTKILPKGAPILLPYYVILRNESVFSGPNNEYPADEFCPNRWEIKKGGDIDEESEKERVRQMQLAFIPFAAGKRNCQGMALAQTELNTVVAYMVSNYHLNVVEEGQSEYMVTLKPKGMRLSLTPRQKTKKS